MEKSGFALGIVPFIDFDHWGVQGKSRMILEAFDASEQDVIVDSAIVIYRTVTHRNTNLVL